MKASLRLGLGTFLVACALLTVQVQADPIPFASGTVIVTPSSPNATFMFPNYGQATVNLLYQLSISGTGTVYDGTGITAFCVEDTLSATLNPGYLYDLSDLTRPGLMEASWLVETYFDGTNQALVQAAVWELALETVGSWDIFSGTFRYISGLTTDELVTIQNWLGTVPGNASNGHVLVSSEGEDLAWPAGNQDFIIKRISVPEPTTLLLLGAGILGMTGLRAGRFPK